MSKEYDAFISYKSEDSNSVRRMVETLKTAGLKIWFAEYEVLLRNYDKFQDAIDDGIDNSSNAILFVSEAWAESRWCQVELGRVLQKIPQENVMFVYPQAGPPSSKDKPSLLSDWNFENVLLPKNTHRESLVRTKLEWMVVKDETEQSDGPDMFDVLVPVDEWANPQRLTNAVHIQAVDASSLDRNELCKVLAEFINECPTDSARKPVPVNIPSERLLPQKDSWTDFWSEAPMSICLPDGFREQDYQNQLERHRQSKQFVGQVNNLMVTVGVFVSAGQTVTQNLEAGLSSNLEPSRALYQEFVNYAKNVFASQNPNIENVFGLHLVHHPALGINERKKVHSVNKGFAISYTYRESESGRQFRRRYAIPISNTEPRPLGEVNVEIALEHGDINAFHSLGCLFDEIFLSLRYAEPPILLDGQKNLTVKSHLPLSLKLPEGWFLNFNVDEPFEFGLSFSRHVAPQISVGHKKPAFDQIAVEQFQNEQGINVETFEYKPTPLLKTWRFAVVFANLFLLMAFMNNLAGWLPNLTISWTAWVITLVVITLISNRVFASRLVCFKVETNGDPLWLMAHAIYRRVLETVVRKRNRLTQKSSSANGNERKSVESVADID